MKTFKQYIIEAAPTKTPNSPPTYPDIPDNVSGEIYAASLSNSISKGTVYGLGNTNTAIMYQHRSLYSPYQSALEPGSEGQDGLVNGGGGFKIQKDSRDYLINLAKAYGIDIETQESMQQKQQQQMQAQQGEQQKQIQQAQQAGAPGGQQGLDHYLMNQVKMHPAMYLLNQDQNLQKEFDKAFKGMMDWKVADKNPDEGKDWYTLWKDKQKKEQEQHKMNLGRMATLMGFRERATEIHNRLQHHGLASDDLLHIKNYLDPSTHENGQQQQQQYDQEDYGYGQSDSDIGYDYSNQNTE